MMPGQFQAVPLLLPAPAPVPLLAAGVAPRASSSSNHVSGTVSGPQVAYSDLNACAWYAGGGWRTLNQARLAGGRTLNGGEDGLWRKRD